MARTRTTSKTQPLRKMGGWLSSVARYRERFPRLLRSDFWWGPRSEAAVSSSRAGGSFSNHSASRLTGYYGSALLLEPLEMRRMLSTTPVYLNDNWAIVTDNGAAGLDNGDIVSNTGAGDDGTVLLKTFGTNAFNTLNSALAGVSTGGTINVLDGSYTGGVAVTQDVTLAGFGLGTKTINSGLSSAGIAISGGADVTINGLTLNGAFTGVSVDASTLHMNSTIVQGASVFGVAVTNGSNAFINTSEITGTVTSAASVDVTAGNVDITNSLITGSQRGLLVQGSGTASVHGSNLTGNTVHAVENAATTPTVIDASGNWWGSILEASVLAQTGGDVDITPYLATSNDLGGAAVGYLGDYSSLHVTTLGLQVGGTDRIS